MKEISEFLKSINQLSEKTNSLNILTSPLHKQFTELAKYSNLQAQNNTLFAFMSISKILVDNNFQNSLLNSAKLSSSLAAMSSFTNLIQNNNLTKITETLTLPSTTLSAISKLSIQQESINKNLIASLTGISSLSNRIDEINKIKNLNLAFTSLSTELSKIASINQNWNIIEDFEELTSAAVHISDQIILDSNSDSDSTIEFKLFLKSVEQFYIKYKDAGIILLFVIDVILRFAGLHQYYDFIKDKSEVAAVSDINEIKKSQSNILQSLEDVRQQINKAEKLSITNKISSIRLKPNIRSKVINELPKEYEILIVKHQPTWLLINYTDPNDGLPQTGWINKKDVK